MDNYARILVRIGSCLCSDGVLLVAHWSTDVDVAVLKNSNSVTKYEVYSSINVTVTIELTLRIDIQGILVTFEAATVED